MTIKEYLEIHSGDDIRSIGIYSLNKTKDIFGRETDIINNHVEAVDLIKYLDMTVDHVHLFIFDETSRDIQGNPINLKHIRACIYVK